jgi:hypothetical protein
VARFVYGKKKNQVKSVWEKFESLDLFTKLLIITLILLAISTPFIVYNYQLYSVRGESQAERLQEIRQLQGLQNNYKKALASSQTTSNESNPSLDRTDATIPNPDAEFSLINLFQRFFMNIVGIFYKSK